MTTFMWRLLVASILFIALAACGGSASGGGGPSQPSTSFEGTWELTEGEGPEGKVEVIEDYRITLNIKGERAGGVAACNTYGGEVETSDGSFVMRGASMTEMACRSDVMTAESAYLAGLLDADKISREGNTLVLTGTETQLRFALQPPVPTSELTDTRWELESLVHGGTDDSAVSSAASAHLILRGNGTLVGSTGCRDLQGEWIEDGDAIAMTTFGAEGGCPDELRQQDGHVVGVLGDGFRVEITGNQLEVFARGGGGLVYRAGTSN